MAFSITYPLVWQLKRVVSSIHAATDPHKKWGVHIHMWTPHLKKWGVNWPLDPVARRPLRWVTSVGTRGGRESRQRSNCTTTLLEVVRMRRPSWGEVRNDCNRWRRCVVDWTVFVRWTPVRESSVVNERLRTRQVVRQQACRPFPPYSL